MVAVGADHGHDAHDGGKLGALYRHWAIKVIATKQGAKRFLIGVGVATLVACSMFYFKAVTVKLLPFDNKSEFQVVLDMPVGTPVEDIYLTEPVVGSAPQRLHAASIGGTRHLAAAQFVHDQHDAVALVASQDGNFTVFRWSETLHTVHAHRIDVLLL